MIDWRNSYCQLPIASLLFILNRVAATWQYLAAIGNNIILLID
jgi:hypothetical protein